MLPAPSKFLIIKFAVYFRMIIDAHTLMCTSRRWATKQTYEYRELLKLDSSNMLPWQYREPSSKTWLGAQSRTAINTHMCSFYLVW
jgi:hypothetical protein